MSLAAPEIGWFTPATMLAQAVHSFSLRRKGFAAALMLALYAALQTFAASETLHHCVHEDSHAPDHECVIKLVADGQVLVEHAPRLAPEPEQSFFIAPECPSQVLPSTDRLLPPGRAPPVRLP